VGDRVQQRKVNASVAEIEHRRDADATGQKIGRGIRNFLELRMPLACTAGGRLGKWRAKVAVGKRRD